MTFAGAPFACCLLAMPPRTCPLAAFAAVLAFSAFFLLSAAAFLSLPSLMAAWRAALRASGRWVLLSLITSSEAPTMARWCLTVRRVRFFATSCRRDHVSHRNISHLVDVVQDSKRRKITGNLRKPNEFDKEAVFTNLGDTLLMHSSVEHRPCYSARILALKEK